METLFDGLGNVKVNFSGEVRVCLLYGLPAEMSDDQIAWMAGIGHPVADVLPSRIEEIKEKLEQRKVERVLEKEKIREKIKTNKNK